jgi:hypothetical protein
VISIHILPYNNPGLLFEIHDIVFWQEAIPLTTEPVYQKIIQTSAGPYNQLNYDEIPLTVNMDCTNPAVCTGHDFYTAFYKGYVVPPADGTYHFYMRSANNHTFWLSSDHGLKMLKNWWPGVTNMGKQVPNLTVALPNLHLFSFRQEKYMHFMPHNGLSIRPWEEYYGTARGSA